MKTFFAILLLFVLVTAKAQVPVPPPATAAQVAAGTSTYSFISPATLALSGGTSDIAAGYRDVVSLGLQANLLDFVSFCSGEGLTNQTWAGAPLTYKGNVPLSPLGATLTGNGGGAGGQILFQILNGGLPPSNSIAITWYAVRTNATSFLGTMFQAVNTNNLDSIYGVLNTASAGGINEGQFYIYDATNTVCWPNTLAGYTNLLQYMWGGGYSYAWDQTIRHVTIISQDGNGNMSCWDDGITNCWYAAGATPLNFPVHPSTALNLMSIGAPWSTNSMFVTTNFANVVIQSISLWSTTPQSQPTAANGVNNLVQAANWVSDWVQPQTEKDFEGGDSRMYGQSATNNPGTMLAIWLFPNAIVYEHFQGGSKMSQDGPFTNLISLNLPHGKVKTLRLWEQKGINDIAAGATTAQLEGTLTNYLFNPIAGVAGASLNVIDVWQSWTNASVEPTTPTMLTTMLAYGWFCMTNKAVVAVCADPLTLNTQNTLDTNRVGAASLDGLHWNNLTNGTPMYAATFGEMYKQFFGINPFLVPYLTPQTFVVSASGTAWTNIYPSPVTVTVSIGTGTNAVYKDNGLYGINLPAPQIVLGGGEYITLYYTNAAPAPSASWMIKE